MTRIRTCLWYNDNGLEAAEFYTALVPDSHIEGVIRPAKDAPPILVHFTLGGVPYTALNGGTANQLTHAASIVINTADQAETDRLWQAFLDDGGTEVMCGWLTDRFGLSWQIVPDGVMEALFGGDAQANARAYEAMHQMVKLDAATLLAAARGT